MTTDELTFVQDQRVARLATSGADGSPHVVPVCYAFDGVRFFTPLDEKRKRVSDGALQRVRNIRASDRVALVIDRYDDDWSRLAYVLIRGRAGILSPQAAGHDAAVRHLRDRYSQYRTMALEGRPIIAIEVERVVSWGQLAGSDRALDDEPEPADRVPPIDDLFSFKRDSVDFMSAESFPASDPPVAPSTSDPADLA
jgi:PPOX class probable F420-dependent enzyme